MAATSYFGLAYADLTAADALLRITDSTPYSGTSADRELQGAENEVLAMLEGRGYSELGITGGTRVHAIARQAVLKLGLAAARYYTAMITAQDYERERRVALEPIKAIADLPANAGADRPTATDSPGRVRTYAGQTGREGRDARGLTDRMIRDRRGIP